MIKKIVAMSFCAAAFVGAMTGPAFAGEVTGNGKGAATGSNAPAATQNGHASACAFSGQQDEPTPGGAKVQNYGHRFDDPFFQDFVDNSRGASALLITVDFGGGPVTVPFGCNKHAADILAP